MNARLHEVIAIAWKNVAIIVTSNIIFMVLAIQIMVAV